VVQEVHEKEGGLLTTERGEVGEDSRSVLVPIIVRDPKGICSRLRGDLHGVPVFLREKAEQRFCEDAVGWQRLGKLN
jgi:hypothetical protein